jgi:uncharacterized membrane protein required for colicin V production
MELIKNFYLIDLVSIILFLRIGYISFRRGFLNESVKLLGLALATFFSLEYHTLFLGGVLTQAPFYFEKGYLGVLAFIVIFCFTTLLFALIRRFFFLLSRKNEFRFWEKLVSLLLGLVRASLLTSVIIYVIWIHPDTSENIRQSYSFKLFAKTAPGLYSTMFVPYKFINVKAPFMKEVKSRYEAKPTLSGNNQEGGGGGPAQQKRDRRSTKKTEIVL